MTLTRSLAAAALCAAAFTVSAPASAVITTFASYTPVGTGANIYWKNSIGQVGGTGGSLYTTSSGTSFTPGTATVRFTFLQAALNTYVDNVLANFTLLATTPSGNPATGTNPYNQVVTSGTFSFTNKTALTVGSHTYAAGTANLLSGTFGKGDIAGNKGSTAGSATVDSVTGTLTFTSDFLDFSTVVESDLALAFTALSPSFFAKLTPASALRTFKASSSGLFSSNPAPLVTAIPEPQVWGLMLAGFGMVGMQIRRRNRQPQTVA